MEVAIDGVEMPYYLDSCSGAISSPPPSEVRSIVRVLIKYDSSKKESIKAMEPENVANV